MRCLFTDETNTDPSKAGTFFIYGGTIISGAKAVLIHDSIEELRREYKLSSKDRLKFAVPEKPKHLSADEFAELKGRVIDIARDNGVIFLAYLVHHSIAAGSGKERMHEFGFNTLAGRFNKYLIEEGTHGMVFTDRPNFGKAYDHFGEILHEGLKINSFGKQQTVPLRRIVSYAVTSIESANYSSLNDIILGAFRFCVNMKIETEIAKKLLPPVVKMMWHEEKNGVRRVDERGFIMRPTKVGHKPYQKEIDDLRERLQKIMDAAN